MTEIDKGTQEALSATKKQDLGNYTQVFNAINGELNTARPVLPSLDLIGGLTFSTSGNQAMATQLNNNANVAIAQLRNATLEQLNNNRTILKDQESQMGNMFSVGNDLAINESTRNTFGLADPKRVMTQLNNQILSQEALKQADIVNQTQSQLVQLGVQNDAYIERQETIRANQLNALGLVELDGKTLQTQQGTSNDLALKSKNFELDQAVINAPYQTALNKLNVDTAQANLNKTKAETVATTTAKINTELMGTKINGQTLGFELYSKQGDDLTTSIMRSLNSSADGTIGKFVDKDGKALEDIKIEAGNGLDTYTKLLGHYANGKLNDESKVAFEKVKTSMENNFGKGFGITHSVEVEHREVDKDGLPNLQKPTYMAKRLGEGSSMLPLDSDFFWDAEKAGKVPWGEGGNPVQVVTKAFNDIITNPSTARAKESVSKATGKMIFETDLNIDGKSDVFIALPDNDGTSQRFIYKKIEGLDKASAVKLQVALSKQYDESKKAMSMDDWLTTVGSTLEGGGKDMFKAIGINDFVTNLRIKAKDGTQAQYKAALTLLGVMEQVGEGVLGEAEKKVFYTQEKEGGLATLSKFQLSYTPDYMNTRDKINAMKNSGRMKEDVASGVFTAIDSNNPQNRAEALFMTNLNAWRKKVGEVPSVKNNVDRSQLIKMMIMSDLSNNTNSNNANEVIQAIAEGTGNDNKFFQAYDSMARYILNDNSPDDFATSSNKVTVAMGGRFGSAPAVTTPANPTTTTPAYQNTTPTSSATSSTSSSQESRYNPYSDPASPYYTP